VIWNVIALIPAALLLQHKQRKLRARLPQHTLADVPVIVLVGADLEDLP
jgi:hypothetical protein